MVGVLVPLLFCVVLTAAQTVVDIPGLGSLQGVTGQTYFSNRTTYEFRAIPYAERPVRFMPPTKKSAWDGTLDVTSYGRMCPQSEQLNTTNEGDLEDCLTLDVYSPEVNSTAKLPVFFYIHGGAFVSGSSPEVRPGFFLEHDMVIVSPQYRLGPLGFLSLGVEEIRGNAGMYDQLLALQWTYDNIKYFGGDPEKITVSGVSAGAASAGLHYVSPLTQDLIKQVILFSGSAVAFWAVGTAPVSHALSIAKFAGCEVEDEVVACLQKLDPLDIVRAYDQYEISERTKAKHGREGTNPVVDGHFLTEMPLQTLSNSSFNGRPMIMSIVKHEGEMFEQILYGNYLEGNNLTDDYKTLKYGIPDVMLSYSDIEDPSFTIATAVKDQYFRPQDLGNYTLMKAGITDFLGTTYFKAPAQKMAELNNLRGGVTYLESYNYYSAGSDLNGVVPHAIDQNLIFPVDGYKYSEEDLVLVRNMTTFFYNFIATGTPTGVSWEPYSLEDDNYLIIDSITTQNKSFENQYTIANEEGLYRD